MTREEAIHSLKAVRDSLTHVDIMRVFDMAIEALAMEHCEDCISRQAVLDAIHRVGMCKCSTDEIQVADECLRAVETLPPVNPQRTGHWIKWYETIDTDICTNYIPHCKCSECGKEYDPHSSQFIKYCNECGAKMVESQAESEE